VVRACSGVDMSSTDGSSLLLSKFINRLLFLFLLLHLTDFFFSERKLPLGRRRYARRGSVAGGTGWATLRRRSWRWPPTLLWNPPPTLILTNSQRHTGELRPRNPPAGWIQEGRHCSLSPAASNRATKMAPSRYSMAPASGGVGLAKQTGRADAGGPRRLRQGGRSHLLQVVRPRRRTPRGWHGSASHSLFCFSSFFILCSQIRCSFFFVRVVSINAMFSISPKDVASKWSFCRILFFRSGDACSS
jgi:hypothetical protein